MNIGYASLTNGVRAASFKTCRLKDADNDNLKKLIKHNLNSLDNIINYNIENNIKLFRISSDIIPFGSSPANKLEWWEFFSKELKELGDKAKKNKIRLSMHPGQYTVLNSLDDDVVERAVMDLEYHNRFLDSLGLDRSSKMVLHIGGVYGDKKSAIERFIKNYENLSKEIKSRLVIENDDKSYTIEEVLYISKKTSIPVVYDNLHNEILPSNPEKPDSYWIEKASSSWKAYDGRQKIHYSQQDLNKRPGSHSPTIDLDVFKNFVSGLDYSIDIMLEVKDKNLSAIKVKNFLEEDNIKKLELEWAKYKYNVLERSPKTYLEIRQLLKDKKSYPVFEFYRLIDYSLAQDLEVKNGINGAHHVWGYFKDKATAKEKKQFLSYIKSYEKGTYSINAIKKILERLALKYDEKYLLNSYYFDL